MSEGLKEAILIIQKLKKNRLDIIVNTPAALERRKGAIQAYENCIKALKELEMNLKNPKSHERS